MTKIENTPNIPGWNKEKIRYRYAGKNRWFELITCDKRIATECESIKTSTGEYEIKVINKGMTYEEIVECFPTKKAGYDYCLKDLLRAIIYEEYISDNKREKGYVRSFWYDKVKYIIEDILGLGEAGTVAVQLSDSWGDLINAGLITYEEMNIISAKDEFTCSFTRDSPFANIIIASEKEDLYGWFKWIPQLFNATLTCGKGDPSRATTRKSIRGFERDRVDLNKEFEVLTIADLDTGGTYIEEAFENQLKSAIEYYGDALGVINTTRLFVRRDQVTNNLLQHQAMPCKDVNAKSESAKKAEKTKWKYHCLKTGGLYKEKDGKKYPAKLELDAFGKSTIEKVILETLLKIINETSDESLIMIPEVMRVFDLQRIEAIKQVFKTHRNSWLQPQIDEFLITTEELEATLSEIGREERKEIQDDYDSEADPIKEGFKKRHEKLGNKIDELKQKQQDEIDAYKKEQGHDKELNRIDDEMKSLEEEKKEIEIDINTSCEDQYDEIDLLESKKYRTDVILEEKESVKLEPYREERNADFGDIGERESYRESKVDEYKQQKVTLFNPVERELENRVVDAMSKEKLDFWFTDLEEDTRTRPHIALLMVDGSRLLDDNISAWEQEYPVFKESGLLLKAMENHDTDVGDHRRGFTTDFMDGMDSILLEAGNAKEIKYPDMPEFDDISGELEELHTSIEKDIENEVYKEDEE